MFCHCWSGAVCSKYPTEWHICWCNRFDVRSAVRRARNGWNTNWAGTLVFILFQGIEMPELLFSNFFPKAHGIFQDSTLWRAIIFFWPGSTELVSLGSFLNALCYDHAFISWTCMKFETCPASKAHWKFEKRKTKLNSVVGCQIGSEIRPCHPSTVGSRV